MKSNDTCSSAENHKGHICLLKREGMTSLIELLTNKPAVSCAVCGVEANSEANVCSPARLR